LEAKTQEPRIIRHMSLRRGQVGPGQLLKAMEAMTDKPLTLELSPAPLPKSEADADAELDAKKGLAKRPAYWTCDNDPDVGPLYYFAPSNATPPPYKKQIEVKAIIDIAHDGTLAGVELVFGDLPPPPMGDLIK
jgi:hypothetical protein